MTYKELREAVDADDGLHRTSMQKLKEINGAGRLGIHVRHAISRELASHGMGHIPAELPPNQEDQVRLYLLGSPIADLVSAVVTPSERGDATLRTVAGREADQLVDQIRQLLCG